MADHSDTLWSVKSVVKCQKEANECISLDKVSHECQRWWFLRTFDWQVGLGGMLTAPPIPPTSPLPLSLCLSQRHSYKLKQSLSNRVKRILLPGTSFTCQDSGDFHSVITNQENTFSGPGACPQHGCAGRGYKALAVTQAAAQLSDHQWAPSDVKEKPVAEDPQL